ncbi:MAG TPA: YggS family pyridoxal phosphate enzyme, partial [Anaerolineae bacterium]|nr:YggS family pyridoxal phosphate enzyme [Anaerolineae bacterium]
MITETALKANLAQVQERIAAAAARAGRSPEEITLVAVTKTHPPELVATAFRLGICHFGENRVEEGNPKIEAVRRLLGSTEQSATSNQQRATSNEQPIWHM